MLFPGSQSRNLVEPISLVNDFWQRQKALLEFLSRLENKIIMTQFTDIKSIQIIESCTWTMFVAVIVVLFIHLN